MNCHKDPFSHQLFCLMGYPKDHSFPLFSLLHLARGLNIVMHFTAFPVKMLTGRLRYPTKMFCHFLDYRKYGTINLWTRGYKEGIGSVIVWRGSKRSRLAPRITFFIPIAASGKQ